MHLKNVLTTKEQKACASVGTKMSLFEEKMKQEREARQKEIDIENRLKKKTPRQLVCEQDDDVMMMDAPPKPPRDEQNIKEVAFALTSDKKAKLPTPKKRATVESAPKSPEKVATVEQQRDLVPASPAPSEASTKNFTGSINSPQPIDCTEDTTVPEENTLDISSILKTSEKDPTTAAKGVRNESRTPMRSSTMKVLNGETPVLPRPMMIDIDLTPVQMEEDENDSISEFAKQIKSKKEEIAALKSEDADNKTKEKPQKPPRQNIDLPPTYKEFIAYKNNVVSILSH